MDGTLVDTEALWIGAEKALVERHGGTWTDADSLALVGSDLLAAGEYLRRLGNIRMTPEEIVEQLIGDVLVGVADGIVWRPGARELLAELTGLAVPSALVTMSYRVLAEAVVSRLPARTFTTIVTGDEVTRGKPHPEAYLVAADRLGVDPADCLVIEDSPTGTESGLAAGARVLSVPNVLTPDLRPGMVQVASLNEVTATGLMRLFEDPKSAIRW